MELECDLTEYTDCDLRDFDCGNGQFNLYLKNNALIHQKARCIATYIMFDEETNDVIGFFSLRSYGVLYGSSSNVDDRDNVVAKPAVEIMLFAIDHKYQGKVFKNKTYSDHLMRFALEYIKLSILPYCGAEYIFLNSVPEFVRYYEHHDFERFPLGFRALPSPYADPDYCIPMFLPVSHLFEPDPE